MIPLIATTILLLLLAYVWLRNSRERDLSGALVVSVGLLFAYTLFWVCLLVNKALR